ncbi:MAG: hypothetical protein AABX38_02545 [Candidatus Micrarchaeota archaeon]
MVNMTLSIPEELYKEMQIHSELKWSEVARKAFEMKIRELHWMDKLVEKSELTEKDVNEIGHKIKAGIRKRIEAKLDEASLGQ